MGPTTQVHCALTTHQGANQSKSLDSRPRIRSKAASSPSSLSTTLMPLTRITQEMVKVVQQTSILRFRFPCRNATRFTHLCSSFQSMYSLPHPLGQPSMPNFHRLRSRSCMHVSSRLFRDRDRV